MTSDNTVLFWHPAKSFKGWLASKCKRKWEMPSHC